MKKKIKLAWIKALKSDNYKQGHMGLRNYKNEYCCLGVLCDIYDKNFKRDSELGWDKSGKKNGQYRYDNEPLHLPTVVREDVGLSVAETDKLMDLNDADLKTFEEIAKWIKINIFDN